MKRKTNRRQNSSKRKKKILIFSRILSAVFFLNNPFMPTSAFNICCPRDAVSRTANVEHTGRHKWVKKNQYTSDRVHNFGSPQRALYGDCSYTQGKNRLLFPLLVIEWNMIVLTIFLFVFVPNVFRLVLDQNEDFRHDCIPFHQYFGIL